MDEALANLKKPPAATSEAPDTEALRQQAKQTLLQATSSGKLDEALANIKKPSAADPDTEQLRQQAKQTLLQATASGKLGEALVNAKKPGAEAPDTEALRQQAKQTLLQATSSGKLDEALAKVKNTQAAPVYDVSEDTRLQVQRTLIDATQAGRLEEELVNLSGSSGSKSMPRAMTEPPPGSPSKATAAHHLQMAMSAHLQDELEDHMNKTVSKVMDGIKAELAKRDSQSQQLTDNVAELSKVVKDLQAKVK